MSKNEEFYIDGEFSMTAWRKAMGRRNRPEKLQCDKQKEPLGTIFHKNKKMVAKPYSQRRCYNGCYPSSDWEFIWSEWKVFLNNVPESNLKSWKELNKFSENKCKYKWELNQ